jgi:hypothetical protein
MGWRPGPYRVMEGRHQNIQAHRGSTSPVGVHDALVVPLQPLGLGVSATFLMFHQRDKRNILFIVLFILHFIVLVYLLYFYIIYSLMFNIYFIVFLFLVIDDLARTTFPVWGRVPLR